MGEGEGAPLRLVTMDGLPVEEVRLGRWTMTADVDPEAGAFVRVLMRERGLDAAEASALVFEAGLQALGL